MPIGKNPIETGKVIGKYEDQGKIGGSEKKGVRYEVRLAEPRYSFADMIIPAETKNSIMDAISVFKYRELLFEKWNLEKVIKNRCHAFVNLYGPSGTGKTMAANAIADALGMQIVWVNYADIESKYVGETSKNIVFMFEEAKRANALILFDEADALLSKRVTDMSSATDVSVNQTRSVLLNLMDTYEGIIVFTTNFIQNYDPAFMRRIPYHIRFDLPNEELRRKLLLHCLSGTIPNSIDIGYIAQAYDGITGSDIANALLMGALSTARSGKRELSQNVFEDAIIRIKQSKQANQDGRKVHVYEREVTEQYALSQIQGAKEKKQ